MPFRQTERLPHKQNKKTERELVLKMAPRKRQQQQMQRPNHQLHFFSRTASLSSTGVAGALSLLHRAWPQGRGDVPSPSANCWENWTSGCPHHPPVFCWCRSRGPACSSCPFPWPHSSPDAATLSLTSFLEARLAVGSAGALECFGKKAAM